MGAFKVGDVVRLKSGGPLMTVAVENTQLGDVYCVWFEGTKKCDGSFPPAALEIAERGIGSALPRARR